MFKTLRNHTKTVVWFLIAAFVLWGASSMLISQNRTTSYAGEVFGRRVSYKEYNDISNMLNLFASPNDLNHRAEDTEIWLHLVLRREAERQKIQVADEEVKDKIRQMFGGERFDARRYEQWVQSVLRDNPRSFEELTREFIRIQKLILSANLQRDEVSEEEIKTRYAADHPSGGEPLAAVPVGVAGGGGEPDEKATKEYRRKIVLEKAKERFTEWSNDLIREARIKKY